MRLKIAGLALLASLVLAPGSADAFQWYVRYGQVKQATKEVAKQSCGEVRGCIAYGTGSCLRRSSSAFDCVAALFYEGAELGTEEECNTVIHWGVAYGGRLQAKSFGRPYCFLL